MIRVRIRVRVLIHIYTYILYKKVTTRRPYVVFWTLKKSFFSILLWMPRLLGASVSVSTYPESLREGEGVCVWRVEVACVCVCGGSLAHHNGDWEDDGASECVCVSE